MKTITPEEHYNNKTSSMSLHNNLRNPEVSLPIYLINCAFEAKKRMTEMDSCTDKTVPVNTERLLGVLTPDN